MAAAGGAGGIEVSIGISPRQPLRAWGDLAAGLESAGVDRLWLIDSQLAMKDVYAGLLLAAQRTTRLRLGPGVTNPLTRHPTVTAGAMAALAELSGGRAVLGLGAGDSAVYGVGWKPARVAQVEAALRFFRSVLGGGEGEWEGLTHRLPHLEAPVPVWLAASQRRMCGLAGRLADGVMLMGPAAAGFVRIQVGWVEEGLHAAGRLRSEIEIRLVTTLSADTDRAGALDDVRSWASTEARLLADFPEVPPGLEPYKEEIARAKAEYAFAEHLSTRAEHRATVSDGLASALAVAGTPDECAERLAGLLATGVDGCIFASLPGGGGRPGRLERLQTIRDLVLPAARAR
ncbi:MAG: LLM class flavin-dependent oxidoreductase [Candidatus Dormibacteraeota bacterium]|nr:LLM class flavin-dependent oxidoreductase [Candidatus Dormibacteraeota bacterium]